MELNFIDGFWLNLCDDDDDGWMGFYLFVSENPREMNFDVKESF